jgi:glucan phosphoethanolaminetransferase (alkaline phosphatase superfamily)
MIFRTPPSHRTVFLAKIIALVLLLAFAPLAWFVEIRNSLEVLGRLTRFGKAPAVYGAVVLLSFVALCITPFLRNTLLRSVFLALFLSAYALDRVVLITSGYHVDTALIQILWASKSMAGAAVNDFKTILIPTAAATAALGAILVWPFPRGLRKSFGLVPIAAIVLVAVHYSSWGELVEGYPSPFLIPARVSWILTAPPTHNQLPLKPVTVPLAGPAPSMFQKVVFIMDESVRGDYLTINNHDMDTTPFLETYADRMMNFGIAVSGGNCSFQSRWLLRRGVRPWQLPDQPSVLANQSDGIVEGPRTTLWQFAKAAGFKTLYIDAWKFVLGTFHSGMTAEELTFVDDRVTLDGVAPYNRDHEAARVLIAALKSTERTFVYVDKMGAHFPYDSYSPPDFNTFTRADGTRFQYGRKTLNDLIGSYKNVIAWSVDGFFRELLPNVDLNGVLIIYTSDHGQNLWDDGYTFWRHCDNDPPPAEVWVPLLAFAGNEQFGRALSASAAGSFNEASHFEIFPTLLLAMGYDPKSVSDIYGPSLLAIPHGQPRRFVIGDVNGRGHRVWVDVAETGSRVPR